MHKLCVYNADTEGPTLAVGTKEEMESLMGKLIELVGRFSPADEDELPIFMVMGTE